MSEDDVDSWVLNLHDVYLNASLLFELMQNFRSAELPKQASFIASGDQSQALADFNASNWARLERLWWAHLEVLREAWERTHKSRPAVVEYLAKQSGYMEVQRICEESRINGLTDALREARGYMFHRDKRGYFDMGRLKSMMKRYDDARRLIETFGVFFLSMKKSPTHELALGSKT